jgi:hypothetical protein
MGPTSLSSGRRVDEITIMRRTAGSLEVIVYEYTPSTPQQIARGYQRLEQYISEVTQYWGSVGKTVTDNTRYIPLIMLQASYQGQAPPPGYLLILPAIKGTDLADEWPVAQRNALRSRGNLVERRAWLVKASEKFG